MKNYQYYSSKIMQTSRVLMLVLLCFSLRAQEETQGMEPGSQKAKLVKNTFESNWILDNQSVMVPIKGTLEMDIQHRFGVVNNGYDDFYGVFAPSNIRLGFSYTFIENLQLGFGLTKERLQWDFNAKYALFRQAESGGWPFSLTYFGNFVVDTRGKENFVTGTDRLSYFNQLIFARKLTDRISIQVAPSLSHFNNVEGYKDAEGNIQKKLENDHFAIAFSGRFKLTESMSILLNYDQPLTTHPLNNPHPNINFGLEFVTSAHAFEVFAGNYYGIVPQSNNLFNKNDYTKGDFLIGFNITRLWNY